MSVKAPVTRFAPSPTGYLHLGHAYSAMLNHKTARANNGRFLLRIEDIDPIRCKPECEDAIYEDLRWLGLTWEEPVRRQSDRMAIYEARLAELHDRGLVYRCFKTRKEINDILHAPHERVDTVFTSEALPADEERKLMENGVPFSWRLSMQRAIQAAGSFTYLEQIDEKSTVECDPLAQRHGDVILGRKDIHTSYHLSCVMDDADQGVNLVIRGQDLADIADLHALLFKLMGYDIPIFRHHQLIADESGQRFAKRDQSVTLRALRASGLTPADIRAYLP